jgi:CheY-like chemotaxis protein
MAAASILICEVDPDVRRLLIVLMARLGHTAVVLDASVEVPPRADVLLLEPSSPRCVEKAHAVRRRFPRLPIVAMGALPESAASLADGPVVHLEKPFSVDALAALVDEAVTLPGDDVPELE